MNDGLIRVGVSGWTHAPWRRVFYPAGLPQHQELRYAASQFRAIEVNATFYGPQRPETFTGWTEQVAPDFVFAVKAPRSITHVQRLRDIERPLASFFASGLLRLGLHLGPVLWQFPSNFRYDPERMDAFLRLLPRTAAEAADRGGKHADRFRAPSWWQPDVNRRLRHAVEIRHESFRCPGFIASLRAHNVALVCADSVAWPRLMDVTADFIYCRMHGSEEICASGYDNDALERWASRFRAWASGDEPADAERIGPKAHRRKRDVFVFFDNDLKVRAPANAMELIRRLRRPPPA